MESVILDFALDVKGITMLSSLQGILIQKDIEATKNTAWWGNNEAALKEKKTLWFNRWKGIVEQGFKEFNGEEKPSLILDENSHVLKECLEHIQNLPVRYPAGLILLEFACFPGYYPFDALTDISGLSFEKTAYLSNIRLASEILGFKPETAEKLQAMVLAEQRAISKYWSNMATKILIGVSLTLLTAGIAAPYIAGAIGAGMGLHGAAAVSAGLAALGGGACTAGGLGMAGGMAAIMGGGAILGLGLGAAGGHATSVPCFPTTLLSSAKIQVMLKEFIIQGQHDIKKMQEILKAQRDSILALQTRIDELILSNSKNEAELNNLRAIVEILETAVQQSRDWSVTKLYAEAH